MTGIEFDAFLAQRSKVSHGVLGLFLKGIGLSLIHI